jgi:hypothetical protein
MRLAIFSPSALVNKMADTIREIPHSPCIKVTQKDIAIYHDMRREALKDKADQLPNATLATVIFNCEYDDQK